MTDDRPPISSPRPLSQPAARLWATLTHISALVGIVVGAGFIGWLGPLIILLVLQHRSAFVAEHARTTLNFQLTMFIVAVIGAALWIFGIGLLLTAAVYVVVIVLSIIASVAANRGQPYEYPLAFRFLR
jgi:hypothetical protein